MNFADALHKIIWFLVA